MIKKIYTKLITPLPALQEGYSKLSIWKTNCCRLKITPTAAKVATGDDSPWTILPVYGLWAKCQDKSDASARCIQSYFCRLPVALPQGTLQVRIVDHEQKVDEKVIADLMLIIVFDLTLQYNLDLWKFEYRRRKSMNLPTWKNKVLMSPSIYLTKGFFYQLLISGNMVSPFKSTQDLEHPPTKIREYQQPNPNEYKKTSAELSHQKKHQVS